MYLLIIIPILAVLIAQVVKLSIDGINHNLNWRHMFSDYGGMPSSHMAFVAALATVIALREGVASAAFAVSFVLVIVVLRDAVGFRREIGKNAVLTNTLTKEIFPENPEVLVRERIGHTLPEAAVGIIFGVVLALILYALLAAV
ncbi:MAG: divergent PAP2 family protein [Candidatus Buchananbacteria bacterium]